MNFRILMNCKNNKFKNEISIYIDSQSDPCLHIVEPRILAFIGLICLTTLSIGFPTILLAENNTENIEFCSNSPDFLRCMRAYKGLPPLPSPSKGGPIAIKVIPFYQGNLPPIYKKTLIKSKPNINTFKRGIKIRNIFLMIKQLVPQIDSY